MKVTIVHDFVKKNNKTMLLLSFCNFFSFGWNIYIYEKLSFKEKRRKSNETKPKQVKMFDNEDEERATDSVSLADCAPPWTPTHPECCFTPTLHCPTPTVKDQTACLATPHHHHHLPPKPSQTHVDVLWQGTNRPDQWIFVLTHFHAVWQTPPQHKRRQTSARPRSW